MKFGLGVTGTVHPDRIIANSSARPGDQLVLTKPLGMGCLTTALKQGEASPEAIDAGQRTMARLNRNASEAMVAVGAHAATDITGFGLLGHALEMATGAGVSITIRADDVPVLEEARPYVKAQFTCGGSSRNARYAEGRVGIAGTVTEEQRILLNDVQTSGGLLIAIDPDTCARLLESLRSGGDRHAAVIGKIGSGGPTLNVV